MSLTSTEKKIVKVTGFLGIFQGTLWFVMSLFCIILYHMNLRKSDVGAVWHILILKESCFQAQVLSGAVYQIIVWIYLWCNAIWTVLSCLMFAIDGSKLLPSIRKMQARIAKCWVCVAILITSLDVITFICLNLEYRECMNMVHRQKQDISYIGHYFTNEHHEHFSHHLHKPIIYDTGSYYLKEFCTDGILPLMSVAARGYIFWVINLGLIGMIIIKIRHMKPAITQETQSTSPIEFASFPPIASNHIMISSLATAPIYGEVTSSNTQPPEQPPNYHDIYPNIYENIEECKEKKETFK